MLRPGEATWSNPRVLAIIAVVFVCGAAVGCLLTRGYLHANMDSASGSVQTMEQTRAVGLSKLQQQLGLSETQSKKIATVLDDYGKFYQNIEDERADVAEFGKRRILDALTPDQRAKFSKFIGQRGH